MKKNSYTNRAPSTRKNSSGGFTLVEVLMAMLILLVGLLGVASMQIMAIKGNKHALNTTERTTTVNNLMEWLVTFDLTHENLRDNHPDSDDINNHKLTILAGGGLKLEALNNDLATTDLLDTHPPPNVLPDAVTGAEWVVYIRKDTNNDGDFTDDVDFHGYTDTDDTGHTDLVFDSDEEITKKLIEMTVWWEDGGRTEITRIVGSL